MIYCFTMVQTSTGDTEANHAIRPLLSWRLGTRARARDVLFTSVNFTDSPYLRLL